MAIPPTIPATLGAVAFLPTAAIMAMHIVLTRSPADRAMPVRATAIGAAALEGVILLALPFLSGAHVATWAPRARPRCLRSLWFGAGLCVCTVATAASVANIICFSRIVDDPLSTILGWRSNDFVMAAAVVLGFAFATQLTFFIFHLAVGRASWGSEPEPSNHPEAGRRSTPRIKSSPYHVTTRIWAKGRSSESFDPPSTRESGGLRSPAMSSIRSSLSQVIRPITSRSSLLSLGRHSFHWPTSLDLARPPADRSRSTEEGFDTWDTSAVDPDNRKTVLGSSAAPAANRVLETIPASPPVSRSPSPRTPLQEVLQPPPPSRQRSRSYSSRPGSTSTVHSQRSAFTQQVSRSEAHIHPLFRSDSPTPPPTATPGTVVFAAPNAGQVISDRQSIRSMQSVRRLRSESLPGVPSPLRSSASVESFLHRREESGSTRPEIMEEVEEVPIAPVEEVPAAEEESGVAGGGERKMTPPIPDWILTAGLRLSLAVYNTRKSSRSGDDVPGGAAAQPASAVTPAMQA